MRIIVDTLTNLRNKMLYHDMLGEYKEYVNARKEYAKYFVQFPEEARRMPHTTGRFSIFSKFGLNVLKTCLRDLFRKKTPEEIEMREIGKRWKAEEKSGWKA